MIKKEYIYKKESPPKTRAFLKQAIYPQPSERRISNIIVR